MKVKVLIHRPDFAIILLEDGRKVRLLPKALNAGMRSGDTGIFWVDQQTQRQRFRIDASEVLPIEIPRDIITPQTQTQELLQCALLPPLEQSNPSPP